MSNLRIAAEYVHLDMYDRPVATRVCQPRHVVAPCPREVPASPEGHERWPPAGDIQALYHSRFDRECAWLSTLAAPRAYAAAYWERHGALPALGHLHLLYNRDCHPGQTGLGLVQSLTQAENVALPACLCICDCPLTPANNDQPPPATAGCLDLLLLLVTDALPALRGDPVVVGWLPFVLEHVGVNADIPRQLLLEAHRVATACVAGTP